MALSIKKSQFRLRVFALSDGTTQLVFGESDPVPDGATLLSDHDVTEITSVTDHVEPTPVSE